MVFVMVGIPVIRKIGIPAKITQKQRFSMNTRIKIL